MIWGQAVRNWGQLAGWGAKTAASAAWRTPTGRGALVGGAAGAIWGMASPDTSVLGGAAMGAGMGAVGGRYGAAGLRRGRLGYAGIGVGGANTVTGMTGALTGFGKGVRNRAMMDFRGGRIASNRALNSISSSLKGWTGGMSPL